MAEFGCLTEALKMPINKVPVLTACPTCFTAAEKVQEKGEGARKPRRVGMGKEMEERTGGRGGGVMEGEDEAEEGREEGQGDGRGK